jgi:hypothetical protein
MAASVTQINMTLQQFSLMKYILEKTGKIQVTYFKLSSPTHTVLVTLSADMFYTTFYSSAVFS